MFAIIIGTHGNFARELLRSCEMICGPRVNTAAIGFESGESIDGLANKYQEALNSLDVAGGVLILTDLFGGSPYNAACRLAVENRNIRIVAGVNLPMLLEVCQLTGMPMADVVNVAQSAGKEGIRTFQQMMPHHDSEGEL